MEPNTYDKVQEVDLKSTMESSYLDYAMSVIVARALPDVKDGLKPVQRRILYAAMKMGATADKKTKKCATIVGETMGHYHPHGDSSIYGALVYMGQPWSMRYPLIEKQGNFGSEDGDSPAASRYTEGKLSRLAMDMLDGINKNTVDFVPNFSNEQGYDEPSILPARIPNILINGTTGIAVGMATNMPPHNLREVIEAAVLMIDNRVKEGRETDIDEIMKIVKGPDFPTGAEILGYKGISDAFRTGRGKIKMRAVCEIEEMSNGKHAIIVKELPYLVYRSKVIETIADLVKEKRIDGITAVNDVFGKGSSDKMRIELRRDVNPQVVLNQLYKHTQLQDTFGANNLCIVDGEPRTLNLKQILQEYLRHQEDVVTRRTQFDLKKAEDRAEIVAGFLKAIDHIDEVIRIIRESEDTEAAKANLSAAFGFTDNQAQAIVDMRLRALTGLERKKLEDEFEDLKRKIAYYRSILEDENKLLEVIRTEILDIAGKYGDDRKTKIVYDDSELEDEDLIADEDVVIAMTDKGYIKRMDPDNFKAQNRGGKGIKGMSTINDDFIVDLITTTTHHSLNFFTNTGRVYRLKTYQIPEASRTGRGVAIVNLLRLQEGEKISAIIPLEEYHDDGYLLMATRRGRIKKTPINMMRNVRKNGLAAINLLDGDELIDVKFTDGTMDALLVTKKGMAMSFNEKDVRAQGRMASGVRGIKLRSGDEVIGFQLCVQGEYLLTVSELGIGKRTPMSEFKVQKRGGLGIRCHRLSEKTGDLVSANLIDDDREILIITNEGIIIRININHVSVLGRNASGVKLMNIDAASGVRVAKVTKMSRSSQDGETEDEGEADFEAIDDDEAADDILEEDIYVEDDEELESEADDIDDAGADDGFDEQ